MKLGGGFQPELKLNESCLTVGSYLLQRGVDRGKGSVKRDAKGIDRGDYRKCDTGGDKAVLDGSGRGFIVQETSKEIDHK
jgi:hypothetical protein